MVKTRLSKAIAVLVSITLLFIVLPTFPTQATQTRKGNFSTNYTITGNGAQDIINVAMAQIGKTGSDLGYSEEWCANFVSDCADLAGQADAVPRTGAVSHEYSKSEPWWGLRQTIVQAGGHNVGLEKAQPGDIVFFSGHVEIVYSGTGNNIKSIGGNTGKGGSCYSRVVCSPREHGSPVAVLRPNYKGIAPDPETIGHVMSESEAAGRTLLDGDYWICSGYNMNYFLDIPGVEISPSGTNVWMWNYENEMPTSYDVWTVTYLNNGFYRIKQKGSSVSLDVDGGTVDRGANVQLWSDNGSNAQQWSIARTDYGYTLQSRCSAFFMDIYDAGTENGTNVSTWYK